VGFLLLRGRCRGCGAAIPRRHLAGELTVGAFWAAAVVLMGAVAWLPVVLVAPLVAMLLRSPVRDATRALLAGLLPLVGVALLTFGLVGLLEGRWAVLAGCSGWPRCSRELQRLVEPLSAAPRHRPAADTSHPGGRSDVARQPARSLPRSLVTASPKSALTKGVGRGRQQRPSSRGAARRMDLRTGTSSRTGRTARLHAVPDDSGVLTAALEDTGGGEDVRGDLALLRDAATLVTARQRLDGLLLQLTVNPFDPAAYRGLGSYPAGPGVLALAAYERVSASAVRGI